jgi:hypothetical protein
MARKFLTPINLSQNEIQNARIQNLASAPSSPVAGQVYFDTTLNQLGTWSGSAWVYVTGGSGSGNVTKAANSANAGAVQVSGGTDKSVADYAPGAAGLLKVAATGVPSLATAGSDYLLPTGNGSSLTGLTQSQISGLVAALALLAPLAAPTFSGHVTVPTPTNSTDAVTKAYADSIASGLDAKQSAVVVSTTNQSTPSGLLTIDGVTLTAGQRVLLVAQTTASQNGLWLAASGSWTRSTDFASGSTQNGTFVFIESGTAGAGAGYLMTGASAVTVDTTSQTWVQFSGAGEINVGTGLTKTGNTISLTSLIGKYAATIGDGTTAAITVTHNLGTQDVHTQIRQASDNSVVEADIVNTSTSAVTITFAVAPAANAIKVVVIG